MSVSSAQETAEVIMKQKPEPKKKKKGNASTVILIVVFVVGLCILLYPTVADYWNSFHSTRAIASYVAEVENLDEAEYNAILQKARDYNADLARSGGSWNLSDAEMERYNECLDISGTGIMGYIEIKKIRVSLPIYHSTEESVLQVAIGHIPGTSLPVGGKSSHCVLSGHRGLPSARLFTDIDKLEEGDTFLIRVLNEIMTYEVDAINIVLPGETDLLRVQDGEDYCTLVTCTPYGVNSHRLLIRGHRIENETDLDALVISEGTQIDPVIVAPIVAVPILIGLLIWMLVSTNKRKKKRKEDLQDETDF